MKDRSGIIESLRWNLGEICALLEEPDLLEVMLNPDGSLWIERFGCAMQRMGSMPEERSRVIISQVASWLDTLATVEKPVVVTMLAV